MFVLFFVSVAILSVSIPKIVYAFKEEGEYKLEQTYNLNGRTAVLHVNETGMDDYDAATLTLKGYSGNTFKLVQTFEAQGPSRQQAIENAKMVEYNVAVRDSVFTFDSNIRFKDDAVFRGQRLRMTLYIPYNHPFVMDEGSSRFITQYVDYDQVEGNTWIMSERDGLTCQTCPKSEPTDDDDSDESDIKDEFGLKDFDEIEIQGLFDVHIMAGDDYAVELIGSDEQKGQYDIYLAGSSLVVKNKDRDEKFNWKESFRGSHEVRLNITMPNLERIEAEGLGSIKFDEFTATNMDIELRGPVKLRGALNAHNLVINLTGKSEAELSGEVNNLDADIQFASKLFAYDLETSDATIEVNGASSAKVNVNHRLEMKEGIASDIDFRGDPEILKRN
jgi:hypothetical protein